MNDPNLCSENFVSGAITQNEVVQNVCLLLNGRCTYKHANEFNHIMLGIHGLLQNSKKSEKERAKILMSGSSAGPK